MVVIVVTVGFQRFATEAEGESKSRIKTQPPLIRMTKREIIGKEFDLGQTVLDCYKHTLAGLAGVYVTAASSE